MTDQPTSRPTRRRTQDAVARVGRLRILLLVAIGTLAVLVAAVTLASTQELLSAERGQSREGELQADLVRFRDDSRLVQVEFWETQARSPGDLPPSLAFDLVQLVARARVLAARERELDPDGEGAAYGERVASGLASVVALTQDYLRTESPAERRALVERAMRGPVPDVADASAEWTEFGIRRERERSEAQSDRIDELVLRIAVLMLLLIGAGVAAYVLLGRARSRLVDQLAAAADEQAALRRVATVVAETREPDDVFAVIATEVAALLGGRATVIRCERAAGEVVAEAPAGRVPRDTVPLDAESLVGRSVRTGTALREDGGGGVRLACPIRISGRSWGVVTAALDGVPPARDDDLEEILVPFARLAAVAVADAEMRRRLAERASTDPLTRLPNHGAFQERLAEETARALDEDRPLALVVLDLDHFKAVNDGFGHQTGDRILAEAADRLRGLCRSGEMLARVGGEEFAWILPDTDIDGAMAAASRGRAAVGDTPFPEVGRLTVSAGVGELGPSGTASELFRRADVALLAAKRGGRDMAVPYTGVAGDDPTVAGGRPARVHHLAARLAETLGWPDHRVRMLRDTARAPDAEGARILAVADVWDTLTADVPRRTGRPVAEALAECRAAAGSRLDASVVAALERVVAEDMAPAGADPEPEERP